MRERDAARKEVCLEGTIRKGEQMDTINIKSHE